jgi:hypothetical protein
MLIFAPKATDSVRFEDYARKMYPQYNRLNVPTWIIGPALGEGPLIESPADAGADPTVAACAIQSAARSACDEALPLTLQNRPLAVRNTRFEKQSSIYSRQMSKPNSIESRPKKSGYSH